MRIGSEDQQHAASVCDVTCDVKDEKKKVRQHIRKDNLHPKMI